MVIGLLELRQDIQMAVGALFIDSGSLANDQVMSPVCMDLVTGCAGNLVLHVTALEAAHVRRLVQMATEADLIGRGSGELAGIADVLY